MLHRLLGRRRQQRGVSWVAIMVIGAPLVSLGCGSSPGGTDAGTSCSSPQTKGCVDLLNFNALAVNIVRPGEVPGADNLIPSGNPGKKTIDQVASSVGATTTFSAIVNGTTHGTVTCRVTADGWVSVRPSVIWQQTAILTCSDF